MFDGVKTFCSASCCRGRSVFATDGSRKQLKCQEYSCLVTNFAHCQDLKRSTLNILDPTAALQTQEQITEEEKHTGETHERHEDAKLTYRKLNGETRDAFKDTHQGHD